MTRNLTIPAMLLPVLFGCAEGGSITLGGSDVSATYSRPYGGDLSGIEIRRIGNDALRYREFQDRAIHNAIAYLESRGVAKERVQQITVETQGGEVGRSHLFASSPRYAVWVSLKDCSSTLLFQAGASGAIAAPRDRSGCLEEKPSS